MTWLDDEDAWWQPGDKEPGVGRVVYWLATVVAALMVIFAVGDFFISWAQGQPILRIVALVAAAVVWLIGRTCRSLDA
ncbi:MAG: hypothetical protein WBD11_02540 [Xanthobacteraceae bacterium]|jgi:hypothetical protein